MVFPDPLDFIVDADLLSIEESRTELFSILKSCDRSRKIRLLVVHYCLERIWEHQDITFDFIKSSLKDNEIELVDINVESSRISEIHKWITDWTSVHEIECAYQEHIRCIITNKSEDFNDYDKIDNTANFVQTRYKYGKMKKT